MNSRKTTSKQQVINRIHILKGQLDAIERMMTADTDPKDVLVQMKATISAVNAIKNNYCKIIILDCSLNDIREVVDLLA